MVAEDKSKEAYRYTTEQGEALTLTRRSDGSVATADGLLVVRASQDRLAHLSRHWFGSQGPDTLCGSPGIKTATAGHFLDADSVVIPRPRALGDCA